MRLLFTLLIISVVPGCILGRNAEPANAALIAVLGQPPLDEKTPPFEKIETFSGRPGEIGKAHGERLRDDIRFLAEHWLEDKLDSLPFLHTWASAKAENMLPFLEKDHRDEIMATAKAVGLDPADVVIANFFPDVVEMARQPFGCSTFVVTPKKSATGGMIVGRNLDYAGSAILRPRWFAAMYEPQGKLRFLKISVPGLAGILTGINEEGVMVSRNTVPTSDLSSDGMPTTFIMRTILENARTAREAVDIYVQKARTVSVAITISDPREAFVLEVSRSHHAVRKPNSSGTLFAANHFAHESMKRLNSWEPDYRWPLLERAAHRAGPLGLNEVRTTLAEVGGFREGEPGDNILAVIVDYAGKRLFLGTDPIGQGRAAAGPMKVLDLTPLMK